MDLQGKDLFEKRVKCNKFTNEFHGRKCGTCSNKE